MTEKLSPQERVRILSGRVTNLLAGKGEWRPSNRSHAIREAQSGLAIALSELPQSQMGGE